MHRHHVEAEIEILAKPPRRDLRRQIAMGGADDPHIDPDPPPAHRRHLARLEHAEKLGLQGKAHVADLIEEDRPPFGVAEGARARRMRAGEGAALMAEELALEEIGRDRRAIHRNERPRPAAAEAVDGARHHFLASPGLAGDEDRHVAIGQPPDQLLHLAHRGTGADDLALRRSAWQGRVRGGQHAGEEGGERLPSHRLGDVVERAEPHRLDGGCAAGGSGDHRNRGRRGLRHDLAEHHDPALARHAEVEQHRIDAALRQAGEPRLPFRGGERLMAEIGDGLGEALAKCRVIVDDQDARHGSSTSKTAPHPASEPSRMVPPWAWAYSRASASPSPVPSARPLTKGSKIRPRSPSATPGP